MKYPFLQLATVNAPYMDEIRRRVDAVVASGRYVGGPEVEELEERLRRLTGAEYAIGVSNGLDALRLILRGYILTGRLQPADEVLVPANTYIASVLAISDAGLTPVLVEPNVSTANLDISALERSITPGKTRAIMPVHLYGRVCYSDELEAIAKKHDLLIIEDNAQAIGASILTEGRGRVTTGALGDAAAFSFYPTKNIGAMGDAGAVTTSDPELAQCVRALANYGADRRYHNLYQGYNCRLDPIQAAVLNVKLPHLDEENEYRRDIATTYRSELSSLSADRLRLPMFPSDPAEMVWHQFVINLPSGDEGRRRLTSALDSAGVGWDIHYATPPHLQPCYRNQFGNHKFPITESLASSCLSLPITRCTSMEDAVEISKIIIDTL